MSNGSPDASPQPRRSNRPLVVFAVLLGLAGAGVGGYFVGKSAADASKAEKRGEASGRAAEAALYAPGRPRYQAIYNKGFVAGQRAGRQVGVRVGAEQGTKVGFERGEKVGVLQGERRGIVAGATAALGGFTDWQVGSWYIVKFAVGANGVPFAIDSRQQMAPNERYAICTNNPADVCSEPITPTAP
jgi:hypothetical protein